VITAELDQIGFEGSIGIDKAFDVCSGICHQSRLSFAFTLFQIRVPVKIRW